MNSVVAQIVEMDQERDRKTCLNLDLKVTGANRELAQWLLDHPRYSSADVAGWLGCSGSRIRDLRRWAEGGFQGPQRGKSRPSEDASRRRDVNEPLETNDNSESDDDLEADSKPEVAAPAVLEDNILYAIGGMNENARVFNKLLRVSVFDRETVDRINTAIDRMIGKWRSIQSTLEKKG